MSDSQFIVSARKYRPATFDTVVGQSSITATLKNAIKNNHVASAYLFCGPRGVGKTTCARILAKTLNCFHPTENMEPCDECESCKSFREGRSFNIHELDAASNNSVDDIRSLIDQVRVPPQVGKYSIFIIDEMHMLSPAAFNAFLKTLEEPPAHAKFILATTEKHKIIPTILSRCQVFDFKRIKVDDMVTFLQQIADKEKITYEPDGLHIIAQKADGAMRDALSVFDQIVSFCGNHIGYKDVIENLNVLDYEYYFRLTDAFLEHKTGDSLMIFADILDKGFDGHNFISGLASHFRDLLVCKDAVTLELLEVGAGIRDRYRTQAERCSPAFLFDALNICNACDIGYKTSKNQRLHVELTLLRLCEAGVEKKKSDQPLTQPVSNGAAAAPEAASGTLTASAAPAPKTAPILPRISIKEAMAAKPLASSQQAAPTEQIAPVEQAEPFTETDLQQAWTAFAEQHRDDPRRYSMLVNGAPRIEDATTVVISLNNTLERDDYQQQLNERLTRHLRAALRNGKITVRTDISAQQKVAKAYTAEDKWAQMCRKNPALVAMKQRMMLDFA